MRVTGRGCAALPRRAGRAARSPTLHCPPRPQPDFVDEHVAALVASVTFFNLNYNLYAEFNFVRTWSSPFTVP